MKKIDFEGLLRTENNTFIYSSSYLKGFAKHAPKIINVLLQAIYFIGGKKDIKTLDGQFNSYCFYQYSYAPYSFRACYILYSYGYYRECCLILRNLIESLAKMKYLNNHKNYTNRILRNKKIKINVGKENKKSLSIKDIFEEVSPGYYNDYYGKIFSGVTHGGVSSLIFRITGDSNENLKLKMGSNWDEKLGTFIVNNFVAFSYLYLVNLSVLFPDWYFNLDSDFSLKYMEIVEWLKMAIKDHKKTNPRSTDWYKKIYKFN